MQTVTFLRALFRNWLALMGSAIFTAIAIYAAWKSKSNGWLFAVSVAAAVLLFLVAAFRTWRDENEKLEEARKEIADLKAQCPRIVARYTPRDHVNENRFLLKNIGETDAFDIHIEDLIGAENIGNERVRAIFGTVPLLEKGDGEQALAVRLKPGFDSVPHHTLEVFMEAAHNIGQLANGELFPLRVTYRDHRQRRFVTDADILFKASNNSVTVNNFRFSSVQAAGS